MAEAKLKVLAVQMRRRCALAIALAVLTCAGVCRAEDGHAASGGAVLGGDGLLESFSLSADRGPVEIEAATLEFDYRSGLLKYEGGVVVSQADIELRSDALHVRLDLEEVGRPREIVAFGNVRIVNGERVASGGRAVFDHAKQTITLSEGAVLRDGPNEVTGERVVVYLEEERSVVEGGNKRVRAVLFPGGDGAADGRHAAKAVGDGG